MDFVTLRLGGPDLVFAEDNRVRLPFTLPRPAAAVHPLLQSFRFVDADGDKHLREARIVLTPHFNAGASAVSGEVEIETTFRDAAGLAIGADLVGMEVVVLLIAV